MEKLVSAAFQRLFVYLLQGASAAMKLRCQATMLSGFVSGTMLSLTAGAMMQLWFADNIELHGLGDGLSFIICLSIMSGACRILGCRSRT